MPLSPELASAVAHQEKYGKDRFVAPCPDLEVGMVVLLCLKGDAYGERLSFEVVSVQDDTALGRCLEDPANSDLHSVYQDDLVLFESHHVLKVLQPESSRPQPG